MLAAVMYSLLIPRLRLIASISSSLVHYSPLFLLLALASNESSIFSVISPFSLDKAPLLCQTTAGKPPIASAQWNRRKFSGAVKLR